MSSSPESGGCGRRKISSLEEVPLLLMSMDEGQSGIAALVENLQRRDLDFIEEAEACLASCSWGASVTPMRQSATFSAAVFAEVLLLGLVLAAFLYLLLRRRDFAILRAMGVPNGPAARGLLGPVALLGLLGMPAGSIPAWGYAP